MLQGPLILLTIVSLALIWGRSWTPGEEGDQDSWHLVRHRGALDDDRDMIRENKLIWNIIKRDSKMGWTLMVYEVLLYYLVTSHTRN